MATPVIMPRQGQSVESCIITKWNKQVGDSVAVGDILFSYETDKAAFDEEAKEAGTVLAIFFNEGDDVPCLTNVMVIGNSGESFAEFDPSGASACDRDCRSRRGNRSARRYRGRYAHLSPRPRAGREERRRSFEGRAHRPRRPRHCPRRSEADRQRPHRHRRGPRRLSGRR